MPTEPTRRLAFLRAVNVGGRTLKMDALREALSEAGFEGVETFLASGNVALVAPAGTADRKVAARIEEVIGESFAMTSEVFVRTPAELREVLDASPFSDPERKAAKAVQIGFLDEQVPAAVRKALTELSGEVDDVRPVGREIHWLYRAGISGSEVKPAALKRALDGAPVTFRNETTLTKLLAKYPPDQRARLSQGSTDA